MDEPVSLIIAGHGSAKNTGARAPICAAVQSFRAEGVFSDVRCALWKEEPFFAGALERAKSRHVVVLPWFMAKGYYTDVVLPRELGISAHSDLRVIMADPLGTDPAVASVLLSRARECGYDGRQSLVILGHGTERSPESARTTFDRVDQLRASDGVGEVHALFIDQEPRLTKVFESTTGQEIIVVPMFAADGWHVSETVPQDLGLEQGICVRAGRRLIISKAAGSSAEMLGVARRLVAKALDAYAPS
jgi:sirohydrochlorin cobaltochelatase